MTIGNALGWGLLFGALVAGTDIPATAPIAAGLAWLILIAVALLYGPAAAQQISSLNSSSTTRTYYHGQDQKGVTP